MYLVPSRIPTGTILPEHTSRKVAVLLSFTTSLARPRRLVSASGMGQGLEPGQTPLTLIQTTVAGSRSGLTLHPVHSLMSSL